LLIAHSLKRQAVTHHHATFIIMHQNHASWVMPRIPEFSYVSAVLES
jgi:hypothetical protein